jgi:flagellar basal-body rod protein FlgC
MMQTSGEAMEAERMRAEVVAANMANAETTRTAQGGPYRRQEVVFAADARDTGFLDSITDSISDDSTSNAQSRTAAAADTTAGIYESLTSAETSPAPPPLLPLPGVRDVAPGVHIAQVVEDPSPPLKRYDPGHPDAGPDGYVSYPDINPLTEMVDLMGATRAYGLNGSAVQAEKGMITSALEIAKT